MLLSVYILMHLSAPPRVLPWLTREPSLITPTCSSITTSATLATKHNSIQLWTSGFSLRSKLPEEWYWRELRRFSGPRYSWGCRLTQGVQEIPSITGPLRRWPRSMRWFVLSFNQSKITQGRKDPDVFFETSLQNFTSHTKFFLWSTETKMSNSNPVLLRASLVHCPISCHQILQRKILFSHSFLIFFSTQKLKDKPNFGGFMLWDASWDQQNVIQGKVYSDHIADIISESGNSGKPTGVPTTATPGYTPTSDGSITPGGTLPPTTPGGSPLPTAGGSTPSTLPVVPTSPPSPGGGDGLGMWDFLCASCLYVLWKADQKKCCEKFRTHNSKGMECNQEMLRTTWFYLWQNLQCSLQLVFKRLSEQFVIEPSITESISRGATDQLATFEIDRS